MPRESIEERRVRLTPGARWILAERDRRGWSGAELGRRLGIAQERVSAYERMQDEPPARLIPKFAKAFGISEVEVFKGLGKPLPRELTDGETLVEYVSRTYPDHWRAALAAAQHAAANPTGPAPVRPARPRRNKDTRPGETLKDTSRGA